MECFELPIYKKSQEIFDVLETITSLFPDDNDYLVIPKNKYNDLIFNILLSNFA